MIKRLLPKSTFAKNVATLMTGTALAQILPIAISPLLTRFYSPAEFSVFAMYVAILAILSVVACLRFEIAVPIPADDKTAIELVLLSLVSTFSVAIVTGIAIWLFGEKIAAMSGDKLGNLIWLIPVGVLLAGCYNAFQYWATRNKAFRHVAKTRMTQSFSGASTQLGLGCLDISPLGLLLGHILQAGAGVIGLGRRFYADAKSHFHKLNLVGIKKTFKEYDRFPKYSTWEALANSAGVQLPVILIATYAAGAEAGYLMLAMRLLSAPMSLIGGSIAQVFLSEAPTKHHAGELRRFTVKTAMSLLKIGALPILAIAILSPLLVPYVFGQNWARAGVIISWMAPWYLMQFITSPVSMALHIVNAQRTALILQLFGLLLRVFVVIISLLFTQGYVVELYALSGLFFYIVYLVTIMSVIFNSHK
ncbi:lipopolysaccharide biosynthesis protein [Aeromonas veronii]